jgi:superfamily II DNA or RNA helicase
MVASAMERRHAAVNLRLIMEDGFLDVSVHKEIDKIIDAAAGPVLIFANHATVAKVVAQSIGDTGRAYALVTGGMTTKNKAAEINRFRRKEIPVLIGTASLATGTDGLDKMCDTLIILDDTDDDSLRRQLVGRIMPRGEDTDASGKSVYRINVDDS